jgi:hypothetical protein
MKAEASASSIRDDRHFGQNMTVGTTMDNLRISAVPQRRQGFMYKRTA